MARIKTVYPTDEVFHRFGAGLSDYCRNPGGNVIIQPHGADCYLLSYGSHFAIAARIGGRLFVNLDKASATTNKHQSKARQAIPRHELQSAIYVQSMREGSLSSADGLARAAESSISAACDFMEKSATQRERRAYSVEKAATKLETARLLLTLAGKPKDAAKVATLAPDADKAAVAAVLQGIKGAEYLAQAKARLTRARDGLEQAKRQIEHARQNPHHSDHWSNGPFSHADSNIRDAHNVAEYAQADYKKAGKKPAPELARIIKAAKALRAEILDELNAETVARLNKQIAYNFKSAQETEYKAWRKAKLEGRANCAVFGQNYYLGKIRELMREYPAGFRAPAHVQNFVARAGAKHAANFARWSFMNTQERLQKADDKTEISWENIARNMRNTAENVPGFERCPEYRAHFDFIKMAKAHNLAVESARLERMAEKIKAWREGSREYLGADAPTMVRIVGDSVETSKGARVPLAHAARLVRMARRYARQGGKEWTPGHGPMVGHFRVLSIGADLSAVIGCHHFSASEGARACDLIEKQTPDFVETETE